MKQATPELSAQVDAPCVKASASTVAFFDLDGTLVAGQTTLLLVRFLRKEGIVTRRYAMGAAAWFAGYKLGLVKVNEKTRHQGARVFEGRTAREVEQLMLRFTDDVLAPRFDEEAVAALAGHQAQGDRVVVISAALEPVVRAVCARLGVTDFVGTACEIEEGLYCGRLRGPSPHGEEKQQIAAAYIRRWGAEAGDCWAYADHGSDVALLRSVGHPVAVNPKKELLRTAREAGWPVLH